MKKRPWLYGLVAGLALFIVGCSSPIESPQMTGTPGSQGRVIQAPTDVANPTYTWDGTPGKVAALASNHILLWDNGVSATWYAEFKVYYSNKTTQVLKFKAVGPMLVLSRSDIIGIEKISVTDTRINQLSVNGYIFTIPTANPLPPFLHVMVYGWMGNASADVDKDIVIGREWDWIWQKFTTKFYATVQTAFTPKLWEDTSTNDQIYMGGVPTDLDLTKPILIFVPGRGSNAEMWWNEVPFHEELDNNMYRYAYDSGYQSYYVTVGKDESVNSNGARLANQIRRLVALHPGRKFVLVCHSKGGIDAVSALYKHGASSLVDKVITLGTPYLGSFWANTVYNDATGALSSFKSHATDDMRTSSMIDFWAGMSSQYGTKLPSTVPFYNLYGNNRGPVGSVLNIGANGFPENDGVVEVTSARYLIALGLATDMGKMDADHYLLTMGKSKTRNGGPAAEWVVNSVWSKILSRL